MSFLPVALAAASAGMQGISMIAQGNAAAAEGQARQQELEREAKLQEIQAKEQQASRLDDLQKTVGSIRALSSQRGFDLSSPSSWALAAAAEKEAYRDTQRTGFNARQSASNYRLAGSAARMSGNAARTAAYLGAAGSFFKAGSYVNSAFQPKPGGN